VGLTPTLSAIRTILYANLRFCALGFVSAECTQYMDVCQQNVVKHFSKCWPQILPTPALMRPAGGLGINRLEDRLLLTLIKRTTARSE
jgi:hypothetical protein